MRATFILFVFLLPLITSYSQTDTAKKKIDVMKSVEVRTKKLLLEHRVDRTIVNVESMITTGTVNTYELLEKIPGVTVDRDGNIGLNGRSGVLVMIDGKQNYMSAAELANYLRSLPGSMVEKMELMDNPPARYDANGSAIINILLKKSRKKGYNGGVSTSASLGKYFRSNYSVNINYRKNKLNLFANVGFSTDDGYSIDEYDRYFYDDQKNIVRHVDLGNHDVNKGTGANAFVGLDYYINKKTTVGITVNANPGQRRGYFNYTSLSIDGASDPLSLAIGNSIFKETRKNYGASLNFQHRTSDEKELSGDISYFRYSSGATRDLVNRYHDYGSTDSSNRFLYNTPGSAEIVAARVDYSRSLGGKWKMETGIKSSLVNNNNINSQSDYLGGRFVKDEKSISDFTYRENINAVYFNAKTEGSRFGIQTGIRVENTHAHGTQLGNVFVDRSSFRRSYTNLFPTIYLNYKLDSAGKNNLILSMAKRIRRPGYYMLNPFIFFRDENSFSTGNPELRSQFHTRIEAKYQYSQLFWVSLSYNPFSNVLLPVTRTVEGKFIVKPENIDRGFMVIASSGINLNIGRWMRSNTSAHVNRLGLRGDEVNPFIQPTTTIWRLESNNNFIIGKSMSAELTGSYASRDLNAQDITKGIYRVGAAYAFKFMNDKGSLRFSFEDIFHSWKQRRTSIGVPAASYYQLSWYDTRRVGIGLSWNFGGGEQRSRQTRDAIDEERSRMN